MPALTTALGRQVLKAICIFEIEVRVISTFIQQ